MIISNLVGGLGNQMFQYACARSLSLELDLPLKFCTDTFGAYNAHNGFELTRVFKLNLEIANTGDLAALIGWTQSFPSVRRALEKRSFSYLASHRFLSESHLKHGASLRDLVRKGGYLHGYWQSERYFASHAAQIRADFKFPQDLCEVNLHIANIISQRTAISVHIRRGDYVSNAKTLAVHGTCSPEYYQVAIDTLLQRCPGAQLIAFSDDPRWTSEVLLPRYPAMVLVEHNRGVDSYIDMRLMSMCQHHIIANSSFSWWGAWLNPSPSKMVIAPSRWFADGRDSSDLVPEGWEKM